MTENTCEHIIGMIYNYEDSDLATLKRLKEHIKDEERIYRYGLRSRKPYTLSNYADMRKSTDLGRFNYCPNCGEKIDWKAIRRMDDERAD